nr:hypothetical protein M3O54_007545 [Xanthomonas nasturtii]
MKNLRQFSSHLPDCAQAPEPLANESSVFLAHWFWFYCGQSLHGTAVGFFHGMNLVIGFLLK